MQHHPRERPTWPLATVCPARLGPHQQALRLQKQLRPGVAPGELVVADKVFVKMPGREAAVARAIQGFHLLRAVNRNPLARYPAEPTVQQTGVSAFFVAMAPAAERSFGDAQQLRRFDLVELTRFIAVQNAPELDHSHTLMGFCPAHSGSPKSPVSPDRSCATDSRPRTACA